MSFIPARIISTTTPNNTYSVGLSCASVSAVLVPQSLSLKQPRDLGAHLLRPAGLICRLVRGRCM